MKLTEAVKELEAWWDMDTIDHVEWENCFKRILSRAKSEPEQEPLENLAKRKGHSIKLAGWVYKPDGTLVVQGAENMDAIRAYLNTLPDVKQEGTR